MLELKNMVIARSLRFYEDDPEHVMITLGRN
jgi:hypothetical protein